MTEKRSLRIDENGRIFVTGIRDAIYVEGEQLSNGDWFFDQTRYRLHVKLKDTGEVFTQVNYWDEETGEALVAPGNAKPPPTDPDFPYRRVYNTASNLYIIDREKGTQRPIWEDFTPETVKED